MPINEADRGEFEAFHDLGLDRSGREILVGLSFEETEWYLEILDRDRLGAGFVSDDELDRKAALDDRHAAARIQIMHAAFRMQDAIPRRRAGRDISGPTADSGLPFARRGVVPSEDGLAAE